MIVFFDVLLVDDESLLGLRQNERFERLKRLITCRPGHAELVKRQVIDLDRNLGVSHLRKALAESILRREEGLVLKPDEPYFNFGSSCRRYSCSPIKVKKEYFKGLGDVGDFAVVGARYDAAAARSYDIPDLKWTHFFLGCLNNKDDVLSGQAKPRFIVIDSVELNEPQLRAFMQYANPPSVAWEDCTTFDLKMPPCISSSNGPDVLFARPPIFDIRCFSFTMEGNTGFYTPRFPQVSKIHYDRNYLDTVTFPELQAMAKDATRQTPPEDSQEMRQWIGVLEAADPRGRAIDAMSQSTVSSGMTPSPCSTRHSQPMSLASASPTRVQRALFPGRAGANSESQPAQRRVPASFTVAACHRPTTALDPVPAPGVACSSRPSAGELGAQGGFKRSLPHSTATAGQSKRPRKQLAEKSVPPTTFPRARETTATMASPTANQATPVGDQVCQVAIFNDSPTDQVTDIYHQATMDDGYQIGQVDITQSDQVDTPAESTSAIGDLTAQVDAGNDQADASADEEADADEQLPSLCEHLGTKCHMHNCDVMLSPCVRDHRYLVEDLLPAHGITEWHTDPLQWAQDAETGISFQERSPPREDVPELALPLVQAQTLQQRRPRKICFVESSRLQQTVEFVDQITRLELQRLDGHREHVEIFDWRVLEFLRDEEKATVEKKAICTRYLTGHMLCFFVGLS